MAWKDGFRKFLEADPERLHFAAHSHHFWPDVTFEAQQQAWLDAARFADDKWDTVFSEVWSEAQRHLATELSLPEPGSIVFAPNTHEFVLRLLSCLPEKARVVTTDSEFHSFERQTRRLEEEGLLQVTRVPSEPFATFNERFSAASQQADLVFFSHVFFNSGAEVQQLDALIDSMPSRALVVIDGYHGFGAVPTNLQHVGARAFYLSGGYKYAMSGEGVCFLHVPPTAADLRPRNTGWFAAFDALGEKVAGQVPYSKGAMRFMGATFDPSGLYRFNAAMRWRQSVGLSTAHNRAHAHALQHHFVAALPEGPLRAEQLVVPLSNTARGQFLTFRTPDAGSLSAALKRHRVITDARDDRLRFGFGPYQDEADVALLLARMKHALR
ncbi:MAG: aminotransferase class V-fold PLP-dependent enzyme [Archangium sp.]|nr:aminotransferase class V-fold PLP-dependent enzyme [Archangium sp.]MDP3574809.1 aminotransferase class V-fold PLP-dependent enzyme [Archangium sp.]